MNSTDEKQIDKSIDEIISYLNKNKHEVSNASFDLGLCGIAVCYYYYASYSKLSEYQDEGLLCIEKCIEMLASEDYGAKNIKFRTDTLDNHLSGLGRAMLFIENNFESSIDAEQLYLSLDETLVQLLISKMEINDFDIDSGALASAYYFLARYKYSKKEDKFKKILESVVEGLEQSMIEHNENQIYWRAPALNNQVFLGFSHGSAMVINFLSKMISLNIAKEKSLIIIKKAISFLLDQKRDQVNGLFPNCFPDEIADPTQFSQCYGDLGIGYSLYVASKALNDDALMSEAMIVLDSCCKRKKEDKLTYDAGITYGASGVGHLFNNLYVLSNNENFNDAAKYWYNEIISYRKNQPLYAGYKSLVGNLDDIEWGLSFDWGISGIGASLMAYKNEKMPNFDELLMIGPF